MYPQVKILSYLNKTVVLRDCMCCLSSLFQTVSNLFNAKYLQYLGITLVCGSTHNFMCFLNICKVFASKSLWYVYILLCALRVYTWLHVFIHITTSHFDSLFLLLATVIIQGLTSTSFLSWCGEDSLTFKLPVVTPCTSSRNFTNLCTSLLL